MRAGREIVVLEARERVGGHVLDETLEEGAMLELGGAWVGPVQTWIADMIAALGLSTFPTYDEGEHLIEVGSRL